MKKILLAILILSLTLPCWPLSIHATEPTTITICEDVYVRGGGYANTCYDGDTYGLAVKMSQSSDMSRMAVLKVDLSKLSIFDNLNDVGLRLYVSQKQTDNPLNVTISAYAWNSDWQEETATWYSLFGTTGLFTPTTEKIAECLVQTDMIGQYVTFSIGPYLAQQVAAGEKYASILLTDISQKDSVYGFSSKETAIEANHKPSLVSQQTSYSMNLAYDEEIEERMICTVSAEGKSTDADLYTAMFDKDERLVGVKKNSVTLSAGVPQKYAINLSDFPSLTEGTVKTFLWKEGTPLTEAKTLKLKEPLSQELLEYLHNETADFTFTPTGTTKESYYDVMQTCLEAYSYDDVMAMNAINDIQTYSRIVLTSAVLIAAGRECGYNSVWPTMMTNACNAIAANKKSGSLGLDFAVKEIMLAYTVMKDNISDEALKEKWSDCISQIDNPTQWYYFSDGSAHNINIFTLAGEWLRDMHGFCESDSYFDLCWPAQLEKFDKNGMYPDNYATAPNCNPILYDMATRVQMQLITGFGYNGKYAEKIETILHNGGLMSLFMQSAAFEFPYGGRSNQYLHNDSTFAACCEYEAMHHKALGDMETAGAYKRAAGLAMQSIDRWLKAKKHIKNFYQDNSIGTEGYGYYDKYMITMASNLAVGTLFTDDTIPETPCPAEVGGYVLKTSNRFNLIFANCQGYSIEIDTNPDRGCDATGLGRIHKKGVPSELGLSTPFAGGTPDYTMIPDVNNAYLGIEVGIENTDGSVRYLSSLTGLKTKVEVIKETRDEVILKMHYSGGNLSGCDAIEEIYTINKDGVNIQAKLVNPTVSKIHFVVPLLSSNGDGTAASTTNIACTATTASVSMGEHEYFVSTDGTLTQDQDLYGNRNGVYQMARIAKDGTKLSVNLSLR